MVTAIIKQALEGRYCRKKITNTINQLSITKNHKTDTYFTDIGHLSIYAVRAKRGTA